MAHFVVCTLVLVAFGTIRQHLAAICFHELLIEFDRTQLLRFYPHFEARNMSHALGELWLHCKGDRSDRYFDELQLESRINLMNRFMILNH